MALSALYKGILYCVLGAVTWGVNGTVSQYLFTHYVVDSAWITALRMIAAGVVLLVLFFPKQRAAFYGMFHDPASLRNLLLLSIFGLLLCQYSYLTAIKYSNSATATVLQTHNVVLMSFFLAVRFRRRPSARELVSVALAVLGVFLVATNGNPSTMVLSPQGLTWGLIGAATPGGWDSETPMTYDAEKGCWSCTVALTAGEMKFRANGSWDSGIDLGGSLDDLVFKGGNIAVTDAGNYLVEMYLQRTSSTQMYCTLTAQ